MGVWYSENVSVSKLLEWPMSLVLRKFRKGRRFSQESKTGSYWTLPLTWIQLKGFTKSQEKSKKKHLIYMDEIRLFAKNEKELEILINLSESTAKILE